MKESWRDIPRFEKLYQASNLGNIRSLDRLVPNKTKKTGLQRRKGQILRPCISVNGYCVVNLRNKTYFVHRLVAETFYGNIRPGFSVNHINGNKVDNRVENLEIVTHSNNCKHAYAVLKRQPSCKGLTNTGASKPVV